MDLQKNTMGMVKYFIQENYKNGELDGESLNFYKDGKLKGRELYKNGKLIKN